MELIDRIDSLLHSKNMTAKELTEHLGLGRTTINDWKRGKSTPSPKSLIGLSHIFGVSTDWLLTGEGPMQKTGAPADGLPAEELIKRHLSVEEQVLLGNYRNMPNEKKIELLRRTTLIAAATGKQNTAKQKKKEPTVELHKPVPPPFEKQINEIRKAIYNTPASAGYGVYLGDDVGFEMMSFNEADVPHSADCGIRISGDSMEPLLSDGSIVWVRYQPVVESGDIGIFVYNGEGYCKKLELDYEQKKIYLISLNKAYPPIIITNDDELRTVGKVLNDVSFF